MRGNLFFLHSWLHSCAKLSHLCRLTQASRGSPDSSQGAGARPKLCSRIDATGEKSEHLSLPLSPLGLTALDMWENYKPISCVMLSFFLPHKICCNRICQGQFIFSCALASSLLPWMKSVIIRLAVNEEYEGLELARNCKAHVNKQRF